MFEGEGSMYWIEYKLFVYLGSYSRPHIIGIKASWFGLILEFKLSTSENDHSLYVNNYWLWYGGNLVFWCLDLESICFVYFLYLTLMLELSVITLSHNSNTKPHMIEVDVLSSNHLL